MKIIALDPGTTRTAWTQIDTTVWQDFGAGKAYPLLGSGQSANRPLCDRLSTVKGIAHLVVEDIVYMGMSVGKEVFGTAKWIGRFTDAWKGEHTLVPRMTVKSAVCGSARGNDSRVRRAILRRYGIRGARVPKGHMLHGVATHEWSSLAVALWFADKINAPKQMQLEIE
jgi:hypothetical protein